MIGKHEVWVLRRPRKVTIGLTLQIDGRVHVTAPHFVSLAEVKKFVAKNEEWIESNLANYERIRKAHPRKKYNEGEKFPLLGKEITLTFRRGEKPAPYFEIHDSDLVGYIPPNQWKTFDIHAPHPKLASAVRNLFIECAKELLFSRLSILVRRMKLYPAKLRFRSQKTRWGSCSYNRVISLNCRLIIVPIEAIDYVIVHELAHLKHYNHSDKFWALVAQFAPNYRTHGESLKTKQYAADFLSKRSELYAESRTLEN